MGNKRVLYADDDNASRRLLQIKLNNADIDCDAAEDGKQALALYEEGAYDLVILDQYMPGMDGTGVAIKIRQKSPDIPLVALTSDDSLKESLLGAGFNTVMVKPVRGEEMVETVKFFLYK